MLEEITPTGGKPESPDCANVCKASHDVAIGLGVGIPTIIACLSILLLYLRERRARRKEMTQRRKPVSLKSDEAPWIKHRSEGHSVTTITSDASPWMEHRVEAYAGPSIPHIELEEIPWRNPRSPRSQRRELP